MKHVLGYMVMISRSSIAAVVLLGAAATHARADDYDCAYDPQKTHLSRIVAVDSTSAPIYGQALNAVADRAQSRTLNLRDREIVLTFDDGPARGTTQLVLDTLEKHCVKATFFSVGRMAQASPKLIQEVERRGHTVGSHTWSHPRGMHQMAVDEQKVEIEKGFAAVSQALGKPIAPFFRFPGLRDSPDAATYLAARNISIWSVDVISGDTDPGANSARITRDVVQRMHALGKGIVLFHDIKKPPAEALDGILTAFEKDGYKFVHVVSNTSYQPDPELVSRADLFRTSPETATITGRWLTTSREQLKDGSVNVMRTEWIELKRSAEAPSGRDLHVRAQVDPQQSATFNQSSWAPNQVR